MPSLDVPADQCHLWRLAPGTLSGVPVLVTFAGLAADRWRDGWRRVTALSVSHPAPWRPWQRSPVVTVQRLAPELVPAGTPR